MRSFAVSLCALAVLQLALAAPTGNQIGDISHDRRASPNAEPVLDPTTYGQKKDDKDIKKLEGGNDKPFVGSDVGHVPPETNDKLPPPSQDHPKQSPSYHPAPPSHSTPPAHSTSRPAPSKGHPGKPGSSNEVDTKHDVKHDNHGDHSDKLGKHKYKHGSKQSGKAAKGSSTSKHAKESFKSTKRSAFNEGDGNE